MNTTKPTINLLDIPIDNLNEKQILGKIQKVIEKYPQNKTSRYITTPYSEFFIKAQNNPRFKEVLQKSFLNLADGIFVQWASYFQQESQKITHQGLLKKIATITLFIKTGIQIILQPKKMQTVIQKRIPGSVFIYDLCRFAAKNHYKIAILGGFDFGQGNTGILAAQKLNKLYPNLQIVEIYPGHRKIEESGTPVINILKKSQADILLCCYGPEKQELWLAKNLSLTKIPIGIGLGGTLDYVSGQKKTPPKFIRKIGLEWFFRPFFAEGLHPNRFFKRILRAWPAMIRSSFLILKEALKNESA